MYSFVFPSDPLNTSLVDDVFRNEYEFLIKKGFSVILFDGEEIKTKGIDIFGRKFIYRGWMLTSYEYGLMGHKIKKRGGTLVVNRASYYNSHFLHNSIKSIKKYSPKTICVHENNAINAYKESFGGKKVFVRDSIKSVTTEKYGKGSIALKAEDVSLVIDKLKKYKGKVDGLVCIREFIDFKNGEEERYMVFNKKIYARKGVKSVPECVLFAAKNHNELFFSVDVNCDKNNKEWIVEMGDGQVSDFYDKGWCVEDIYQFLLTL